MSKSLPYSKAKDILNLKEKVGQFFMPAAFINDTEEEVQFIENLIQEHHIGGLCFFHSRASAATNFEGKKTVVYNEQSFDTLKRLINRYQKVSKHPLLISIDAEWGLAMRIENTPQYPYAITLGAIQNNTDLLYEVGKNIAKDCKLIGIHWNLSPVVDINNNPLNPVIGYRSFGEYKNKVVEKARAFISGTKSEGVLTSIKHFPGHGDTGTDSHLGLPVIEKSIEELWDNELFPFRELINEEEVDSVMVGHLAVPALSQGKKVPATISKDIITGVLRTKLGFKGVVITDALNMHSVSKMFPIKGELEWAAFDAGNDLLCFTENVPEGIETIQKKATQTTIEEAFERVWKLKQKAFSNPLPTCQELTTPETLNKKLAENSLTLFQGSEEALSDFKKEGFLKVALGKEVENHFFRLITDETLHTNNVLVALFPPKIKPKDNFEIPEPDLKKLKELLDTKNVVLYLFGNPYVLNILNYKKAKVVVIAYQDFKVFQENAAYHFLDKIVAKGELPVTIHS
ncbi:beta-glucosidase-like glycosyl hydrolase [Saonia flava]|uniref:beta-N-acetylhexosaminidase n=1 Tax=Saonia flava TaxID=523696 RepID=A0A846R1E6_9FLAO|nr:glycoside hydrolase family 3 protein [Saonia flava]NJB72253.1 beta-glucosidase-like glycosyl hydrolase [Saonia flava]